MKNIFFLPTDEPSRLWLDNLSHKLVLSEIKTLVGYKASRNVYITNDEEIKEGDFYFDSIDFILHRKSKYNDALVDGNKNAKKIILTTDYDLIEEGVQAVDNHFLKWFVNNQTCEYVEVEDIKTIPSLQLGRENGHLMYKIIIPTENPTTTVVREAMKIVSKDVRPPKLDNLEERFKRDMSMIVMPLDNENIPEEETLEEAAKNYAVDVNVKKGGHKETYENCSRIDFIAGAKWQTERMYSQEEVLEHLNKLLLMPNSELDTFTDDNEMMTNKWFERFKNK